MVVDHKSAEAFGGVLERLREEGIAALESGGDLDVFLADRGEDGDNLLHQITVARLFLSRTLPEAAVQSLIVLHASKGHDAEPAVVANRFAEIVQNLQPSVGMREYLQSRARSLCRGRLRASLVAPADFLSAVGDLPLAVRDHHLRADILDALPLEEVFECLAADGIRLWCLRQAIEDGREEFDRSVALRWDDLAPGIEKGFSALFEDGHGPQVPRDYLSAFPGLLVSPSTLDLAVAQIGRRKRCRDGFSKGPDLREWLAALADFRCWTVASLRRLALWDDLLDVHAGEYLDALAAAAVDVSRTDGAAAAFAVMTLARHARSAVEEGKGLADVEREERHAATVAALPGGPHMAPLVTLLAELPLGRHDQRAVWAWLTDDVKANWRRRAIDATEGSEAVADALVEYVLSWTDKRTYADLEPLVLVLQSRRDRRPLLTEIAASPGGPAGARARYLLDAVTVHPPDGTEGGYT